MLLGEPYTRQLAGELRELRFYCSAERIRITYWIAPERQIIMLTAFAKTRKRETAEITWAGQAMARCQQEADTRRADRPVAVAAQRRRPRCRSPRCRRAAGGRTRPAAGRGCGGSPGSAPEPGATGPAGRPHLSARYLGSNPLLRRADFVPSGIE
jgi:hypothetical protein